MGEQLLPLFPLQAVLFPHSALPLHIFEERYKKLINDCVNERKEFGIILSKEGVLSGVGCTAMVRAVLQRYDDGRMDIIAGGKHRFTLNRFDTGGEGYAVGEVDVWPDDTAVPEPGLASDTVTLYRRLVAIVFGGKTDPRVDSVIPGLSFVIAQKAGLDLEQRQRLLETPGEDERLEMLHRHFVNVIPKLEHLEEIERVVRCDGYIDITE